MKKVIFFSLILVFIYSCKGCEDEKAQLTRSCAQGYIENESNTECVCPPETHLEVRRVNPGPSFYDINGLCVEKGEYVYYAKVSHRNCITLLTEEFLKEDPIGIWTFGNPGNNGLYYPYLNYALRSATVDFFANTSLEKHADGSVEVSFVTKWKTPNDCLDWGSKTDNAGCRGYGHGISNTDNTKLDIEIIYKNGIGTVLDTGYIYLWKE